MSQLRIVSSAIIDEELQEHEDFLQEDKYELVNKWIDEEE